MNESQIRALVERWAKAVRAKDMDSVFANHTADIVMFDVPLPLQSRGIEEYKKAWELFFDSQSRRSWVIRCHRTANRRRRIGGVLSCHCETRLSSSKNSVRCAESSLHDFAVVRLGTPPTHARKPDIGSDQVHSSPCSVIRCKLHTYVRSEVRNIGAFAALNNYLQERRGSY